MSKMAESTQQEEIQVNVVLEECSCGSDAKQYVDYLESNLSHFEDCNMCRTVRMIGFVVIDKPKMKLSDFRLSILSQFDAHQLQIIGTNFKFLKKGYPVSSKQESLLKIDKICINVSQASDSQNISLLDNGQPNINLHNTSLFLETPNNLPGKASMIWPSISSSVCMHNNKSLHDIAIARTTDNDTIMVNDSTIKDEKMKPTIHVPSKAPFNANESTTFDAMPHHYQYMHNHSVLGKSPQIQPTMFPADIAQTSPDKNDSVFPKVNVITTDQPSNLNECGDLEYTVMIRACHKVLHRSSSDAAVTLHSLLDSGRENRRSSSMSVFKSFDLSDYKRPKSQSLFFDHQPPSSNLNLSRRLKSSSRKEIESKTSRSKTVEAKIDIKPQNSDKITKSSEHFISQNIKSPKSTRLETKLGQKLPRIGPKSSKGFERTNEVNSILKNAMVPKKVLPKYGTVHDHEEISVSISTNEQDALKATTSYHGEKKLEPPNVSIVPNKQHHNELENFRNCKGLATPPHTFLYSKNSQVPPYKKFSFDHLIDDSIQNHFTVIGSPIDDELDINDDGDSISTVEHDNIIFEFVDPTELIKGLSGVHHSVNNPLWLDLVCDRSTFMSIAEHIRPPIHNLTIEDCLTLDCREKLEIFKDYLYINLKTSSDDHTTTENINILVFKTLIITYHLGHDKTVNVLSHCQDILHKKFGNICPSPSWICHAIIDNVIDIMMPEVEDTVREVETCEQFVFKLCNESQNELLHRMQIARAWMVLYRSRLWPKSTIAHNLLNNFVWRKDFLPDVPQPYWRDINDHVARMVDLLELGTQTLESIQNIFVAKVSLEMTEKSNNLAKIGGRLAGVGAVFLPLTVITGIWGMNCKVPFQYDPDSGLKVFNDDLFGFLVVIVIMVVSSIVTWKVVDRNSSIHDDEISNSKQKT